MTQVIDENTIDSDDRDFQPPVSVFPNLSKLNTDSEPRQRKHLPNQRADPSPSNYDLELGHGKLAA